MEKSVKIFCDLIIYMNIVYSLWKLTGWPLDKVITFWYGVLAAILIIWGISVYLANQARKKCRKTPKQPIVFGLLIASAALYLVAYFNMSMAVFCIPAAIGLNFGTAYIAHKHC